MATAADPNISQAPQSALLSTAHAVLVGLAWGAVMLFVFGFWMRFKYEGGRQTVTYIFLAAGVAAAALALWQAFTLWIQKETPEQKTATLELQRRIFSYVFLAGGLGLIVLAFVLGIDKKTGGNYGFKLDNFAETFGALLFGLISLAGGYALQQPLTSNASPIQFLLDKVHTLKLSQIVLGVASLGTFAYLFFTKRNEFGAYFPELAALLFISMLCLGCLLWLNTGQFDEFGIRLFVLVFGGATGLILFLMVLCRAYLWRQDIFLGGSASWQGENAWRFWLCAYGLFASLVLMFVSFNLARADIRRHVALRRVMYGYDTLVQGMLLIGIMGILNIVIYALVPFSFDWTKNRGAYALSESSKNLIAGLKQEVHVFVLLPQNHVVYKDVRLLLENCQALNNKLGVEYISPDVDDRKYEELADKFPKILQDPLTGVGRGILIVNGPIPKKGEPGTTQHAFVAETKLHEPTDRRAAMRGEKVKSVFKGETEILGALKFLVQGKEKRKIYILQGNGEADINNMEGTDRTDPRHEFSQVGIGFLVDRFKKDNYDVSGLSFGPELPKEIAPNIEFAKGEGKDKRKEVPKDCKTLIIAGASKDLPKETLDAIESYMDRGGKLMVFLDVFIDSEFKKMKEINLEAFLKRFGVDVTNDVLLRLNMKNQRDDPTRYFATTPGKTENQLGKGFSGNRIEMKRWARVVRPSEQPGQFRAEVVLQQEFHPQLWDRYSILHKDVRVLLDPVEFIDDVRENEIKLRMLVHTKSVPLAVAVTDGDKPRMVVFGDTDFITNREIILSKTRVMNYDFVSSSIEWMAEREGIGASPRISESFKLPDEVDFWRMVVLPGWLMLLTLIGLGMSFWIVRRR